MKAKLLSLLCLLNVSGNVLHAMQTMQSRCPFHYAVTTGNYDEVVRRLEAGNVDVNERDPKNDAPLHCVIFGNMYRQEPGQQEFATNVEQYHKIARLLLERGAQVNIQGMNQRTPLALAAAFADERFINILLQGGAALDETDQYNHPLCCAAKAGNVTTFHALLARGITADYNSLLVCACRSRELCARQSPKRNPEIINWLLDNNADINTVIERGCWGGRTPLFEAIQSFEERIVKLLLARGADVNLSVDYESETNQCCREGTIKNFSPLHLAAYLGNFPAVRQLVGAGANLAGIANVPPHYCPLPEGEARSVDVAVEHRSSSALQNMLTRQVHYYLNHTARPTQDLIRAIHGGSQEAAQADLDAVQTALGAGADVNIQLPNGDTPMHRALKLGRCDIARELLKHNPDLSIRNNDDQTVSDCVPGGNPELLLEISALEQQPVVDRVWPEEDAPPSYPEGSFVSANGWIFPGGQRAARETLFDRHPFFVLGGAVAGVCGILWWILRHRR